MDLQVQKIFTSHKVLGLGSYWHCGLFNGSFQHLKGFRRQDEIVMILDLEKHLLWVFKNDKFMFAFRGVTGTLYLSCTMAPGDSVTLLPANSKLIEYQNTGLLDPQQAIEFAQTVEWGK
jgi:hypothetical protein